MKKITAALAAAATVSFATVSYADNITVGVSWSNFQEERWKTDEAAIKNALEKEELSWSRYKSYLQILEGEDETAHFRTDIWNEDQDTQ